MRPQVLRAFPATGISRVILRAEMASRALVDTTARGDVALAGTPQGGASGYHPADPNWRETPPGQWGLDFRGKTFGHTLVVSTFNEIRYIHHHYYLDHLAISVPRGVTVVLEVRRPSGQGAADLREP